MKKTLRKLRVIIDQIGQLLIEIIKMILIGIACLFSKIIEKSLGIQVKILENLLIRKAAGLFKSRLKNLFYFITASALAFLVSIQFSICKKIHILK